MPSLFSENDFFLNFSKNEKVSPPSDLMKKSAIKISKKKPVETHFKASVTASVIEAIKVNFRRGVCGDSFTHHTLFFMISVFFSYELDIRCCNENLCD